MAFTDWFRQPSKEVVKPVFHVFSDPKNSIKEQLRLKGEVVQNELRFPEELGEVHPFNFKTTEGIYLNFGLVTGAVDKIVDFVWGPGFFTVSKDARAKELIDNWMEDVEFSSVGRKWLREALIKGTGFLELGGKQEEVPQGIKVLNATNMFIKQNNKGLIEGFNQFVGDTNTFVQSKVIQFKPFEVAHLPLKLVGDSPYGWGMLFPALKIIDNILQTEKDMHSIVKRKANAPIIVTVGDLDKDIMPTAQDVEAIGNKLQFMNAKTEWVFSADTKVEALNFGKLAENSFEFILNHDLEMLFFTFQIPEVLMGRSVNLATAPVQMDAFERMIKSIQVEVEKVIENKIFGRVLQANGLDADVEFEWGQPSLEATNERLAKLTELLKSPFLSEGLRSQLELQVAELLDIDQEDVESAQQEREREEEQPQPIVPGQNGEFVVGKVISL